MMIHDIFYNHYFWELIALIILLLSIYKKVSTYIKNYLDTKIDEIKNEIDTSEKDLNHSTYLLNEKNNYLNTLKDKLNDDIAKHKLVIESQYENLIGSMKHSKKILQENLNTYFKYEENNMKTNYKKEMMNQIIDEVGQTIKNNPDINHNNLIQQSIKSISIMLKK